VDQVTHEVGPSVFRILLIMMRWSSILSSRLHGMTVMGLHH